MEDITDRDSGDEYTDAELDEIKGGAGSGTFTGKTLSAAAKGLSDGIRFVADAAGVAEKPFLFRFTEYLTKVKPVFNEAMLYLRDLYIKLHALPPDQYAKAGIDKIFEPYKNIQTFVEDYIKYIEGYVITFNKKYKEHQECKGINYDKCFDEDSHDFIVKTNELNDQVSNSINTLNQIKNVNTLLTDEFLKINGIYAYHNGILATLNSIKSVIIVDIIAAVESIKMLEQNINDPEKYKYDNNAFRTQIYAFNEKIRGLLNNSDSEYRKASNESRDYISREKTNARASEKAASATVMPRAKTENTPTLLNTTSNFLGLNLGPTTFRDVYKRFRWALGLVESSAQSANSSLHYFNDYIADYLRVTDDKIVNKLFGIPEDEYINKCKLFVETIANIIEFHVFVRIHVRSDEVRNDNTKWLDDEYKEKYNKINDWIKTATEFDEVMQQLNKQQLIDSNIGDRDIGDLPAVGEALVITITRFKNILEHLKHIIGVINGIEIKEHNAVQNAIKAISALTKPIEKEYNLIITSSYNVYEFIRKYLRTVAAPKSSVAGANPSPLKEAVLENHSKIKEAFANTKAMNKAEVDAANAKYDAQLAAYNAANAVSQTEFNSGTNFTDMMSSMFTKPMAPTQTPSNLGADQSLSSFEDALLAIGKIDPDVHKKIKQVVVTIDNAEIAPGSGEFKFEPSKISVYVKYLDDATKKDAYHIVTDTGVGNDAVETIEWPKNDVDAAAAAATAAAVTTPPTSAGTTAATPPTSAGTTAATPPTSAGTTAATPPTSAGTTAGATTGVSDNTASNIATAVKVLAAGTAGAAAFLAPNPQDGTSTAKPADKPAAEPDAKPAAEPDAKPAAEPDAKPDAKSADTQSQPDPISGNSLLQSISPSKFNDELNTLSTNINNNNNEILSLTGSLTKHIPQDFTPKEKTIATNAINAFSESSAYINTEIQQWMDSFHTSVAKNIDAKERSDAFSAIKRSLNDIYSIQRHHIEALNQYIGNGVNKFSKDGFTKLLNIGNDPALINEIKEEPAEFIPKLDAKLNELAVVPVSTVAAESKHDDGDDDRPKLLDTPDNKPDAKGISNGRGIGTAQDEAQDKAEAIAHAKTLVRVEARAKAREGRDAKSVETDQEAFKLLSSTVDHKGNTAGFEQLARNINLATSNTLNDRAARLSHPPLEKSQSVSGIPIRGQSLFLPTSVSGSLPAAPVGLLGHSGGASAHSRRRTLRHKHRRRGSRARSVRRSSDVMV